MGSGMTFRRLGVAVVATAFTALVGMTAASAATTGDMTTNQNAAAGTGGAGAGASGKSNQCESRADKRHLAGDQRDSYIKRCMASTNKSHHKKPAKPSSAAMQGGTGGQTQQGGSTSQ